jgi:hypothetical protein
MSSDLTEQGQQALATVSSSVAGGAPPRQMPTAGVRVVRDPAADGQRTSSVTSGGQLAVYRQVVRPFTDKPRHSAEGHPLGSQRLSAWAALGSQLQPCRLVRWTGGHRRHSVTLPRLGSVVGFGHARILSVTNDPSARGVPHGCAKTTQLLAARCRAWS